MGRTTAARGRLTAAFLAAVFAGGLLPGRSLRAADPIHDAIDRGMAYLLDQVQAERMHQKGKKGVGQVALETYALVVAGVAVDHKVIRENFEFLHNRALGTNHTYTIACYIFALDAAISQLEQDFLILQPKRVRRALRDDPRIGRHFRPYLHEAVKAIVRLQNKEGAWRYGPTQDDYDNSNTQFAVLALGVGAKRRVPISPRVWLGVLEHFLKDQQEDGEVVEGRLKMDPEHDREKVKLVPRGGRRRQRDRDRERDGDADGGDGRTVVDNPENPAEPRIGTEDIEVRARAWPYKGDKRYDWNMTCAGLSSLLLARASLRPRLPPKILHQVNKSVRDGYGWLMKHWKPTGSWYGIYSLEKVADIGGVVEFDGHDWYQEVTDFLVEEQQKDGSWKGGKSHGENVRVATAFSLLVLKRATSLLTMNPASLIVVSGRSGGGKGGVGDRDWVYVPDLDVRLHYPTLMRTIRLRPRPELIRFLRNIVENYPQEWKGELVPGMVAVRDNVRRRSVRRVLDGYLEDITGADYDEAEKYERWHERWQRVMEIGRERKEDAVSDLLSWYESTHESFVLKKAIIWALIQCKAREALPLFLDDLDHDESRVRVAVWDAFRAFFIDRPPEYDPLAPSAQREEQVQAVRQWFSEQTS